MGSGGVKRYREPSLCTKPERYHDTITGKSRCWRVQRRGGQIQRANGGQAEVTASVKVLRDERPSYI